MVGQWDKLEYNTLGVRTRFGRVWIPMGGELRTKILDEAHKSRYSIHPGTNKMYQDPRKEYWWPGMKHEVTKYVSKFDQIKARMKAAQDRQKYYADKRRRPIEFDIGDKVMLIMPRVGEVAYQLEFPDELRGIHPTFQVSHLRKCLADESAHVPLTDIEVDNNLNYIEEPLDILDRKEKRLRNKDFCGEEAYSQAGPAYLSSTQEAGPAYLSSTQELGPTYLSSTQEQGPVYLLSAQAPGLWIVCEVVGPSIRTTETSLSGNEGYGCGMYVMGLYLLGAFVVGQLLYNWGDDVLEVWLRQVMMMDGDAGRLDELPG
ncbi:hypothetical protein L1987_65151 [Smallanthus sonchifolius]|uniref:Uncharacterized protein n=1 Tax=Smallanthus sonchifolius TaxID=185202 RepID=A0ACB9BTW4_9ASTR|nr:hypothetical protein L1987_65151 [Smallanthus sonchifolius]